KEQKRLPKRIRKDIKAHVVKAQPQQQQADRPKTVPFTFLRFDLTKEKGRKDELFRTPNYPRSLLISPKGDYLAVWVAMRHFFLYDIANAVLRRYPFFLSLHALIRFFGFFFF